MRREDLAGRTMQTLLAAASLSKTQPDASFWPMAGRGIVWKLEMTRPWRSISETRALRCQPSASASSASGTPAATAPVVRGDRGQTIAQGVLRADQWPGRG